MTNVRYLGILVVLLIAPLPSLAQSTPRSVAARFYRACVKLQIRGLPNKKQRKVLWPLLSPDLKQMFDAAEREQSKYSRAHPEDKPPWAEGNLFSSLYEGAQTFSLGVAKLNGDRAEITAHLSFKDRGGTERWTDTLILSRTRGRWLVWDIAFNGDWPLKTGNSLREVLKID
jgi:hypothetical protein